MLIFQVLTYSHLPSSMFCLYQLHCPDSILRSQGGGGGAVFKAVAISFQVDVNILNTWETTCQTEHNGIS